MKTLYLMRHAKSSWDNSELSDYERPLNRRGEKAAPLIGLEMAKQGFEPELIVSSPAVRASQTAKLVAKSIGYEDELKYDTRIYGAGVNTLFYILLETPDAVSSVLMTGHNPGFEDLLEYLSGEYRRMPTAALAVVEFDSEKWSEIKTGEGDLVEYIIPRDLTEE